MVKNLNETTKKRIQAIQDIQFGGEEIEEEPDNEDNENEK